MIIIFTGPPLAGKGTQAQLLAQKLHIPFFSIGALLREEYQKGNQVAVRGYEEYAMKGKNLPIDLKFNLLKQKLDASLDGFILENFPATQEDLETFLNYVREKGLRIHKVFHITVSEKEMEKRIHERGRIDDTEEIVKKRREIQGKDRQAILDYFDQQGILVPINGNNSIEDVHEQVLKGLGK